MNDGNRDSSPDARVLRELVREAQRDPLPELNWDRLESRLFAELDETPSAVVEEGGVEISETLLRTDVRAESRTSQLPPVAAEVTSIAPPAEPRHLRPAPQASGLGRTARWFAALAVAAGLLGIYTIRGNLQTQAPVAVREPVDLMKLPPAQGMGAARDLNALKDGDVVEATVGPVAFGQPGAMSWTLAAGSRVVVHASEGDSRVVELESGSIRGAVEKGSGLRFVVMAGDTEIVSFGEESAFSVTRSSKQLVVNMEHGSATVSGRDGASNLRKVDAPLLASVSLDGGIRFEILREERELIAQSPLPPQHAPLATNDVPTPATPATPAKPQEAALQAPKPSSTPSAEPTVSALEGPAPKGPLSIAAAGAGVRSCIVNARAKQSASQNGSVSVSVSSTLRLTVAADGAVKGAVFNPPLQPALQSCAVFLLHEKLEGGSGTVEIPINLN